MNAAVKPDPGAPIELASEPDFMVGALTVRPCSSEVVIDGAPRRLEPRVMQTLVALAQANGAVVSRAELMARCWSGMVVGEDALTRAIGQLRRLTDHAPASFSVETVPKIGYRLTAASTPRSASGGWGSRLAASLALVAVVAIAGTFSANVSYSPIARSGDVEQRELLGTQHAEARDRHLRATALLGAGGRDNVLRAEELLREALALDPSFHAAKETLVVALEYAAAFVPEYAADAQAEVDELLDSEIVETPVVWRGYVMQGFRYGFEGDWLAAERALARARANAPRAETGPVGALEIFIRASVGRIGESFELVASQAEQQPASLDHSRGLQQWLDRMGRHDEAEAEYERSRDLPGDRSGVELTALVRALGTGDAARVAARLERYRATDWGRAGDDALVAVIDDRSAALSLLRRQIWGFRENGAMPPFLAAAWASYYGDDDLAVEALRAHPESLFANPGLLWDTVFVRTRGTTEFKALLRDFRYVEYWRAQGTWGDFCRPTGLDDFECR